MDLIFWNRMQELCKEKKTTPTAIAKQLGLSTSMVTQWKKGRIPNGKTLSKIADHFSVTTNYLLGYKTEEQTSYSEDEKRLIAAYRNQSDECKKMVRKLLDIEEPTNRIIDDLSDPNADLQTVINKAFTKTTS